jgi:tetratricopeptide (TPR) repeat protein
MAYVHTGRLENARAELAHVQRLRAQPTLQRARMYDEETPAKLMAMAHDTLAGTIARAERRHDEAIALLRKAADIDDDLGNDPPLYGGGARLALAGALLDAGKAEDASKEIAEAMRLNGPSAWTYQGLAQVAELRGARDEVRRHAEQARVAWKNAEGATLPRL